VTAFWKAVADRTGEAPVIAFAQRLVTLTDWVFTLGGVILILVGGYGMTLVAGLNLHGSRWLVWGQALFIASGVIWLLVLIPAQIAQARLARDFAQGGQIPERYRRLNRRWMFWGIVATLLPLANIYFMVFKP
jgi:uncharacterized membrane protein